MNTNVPVSQPRIFPAVNVWKSTLPLFFGY
jgi:hypothetical protein